MRIAVLTLEALAAAAAVRRFVAAHAPDIALVGLSDPFRPQMGGAFGQTWRRVRHSGPRILPYLALNFALPPMVGALTAARWRDGAIEGVPLEVTCRRLGVRTAAITDVNGPAFAEALAASGAELVVTFHFDQILSAATIGLAPRGGINVHAGLLPQHRGPVPTIHALLDDPVKLGVSIHRLAPKIDAGGLLAQAALPYEPGLTALGAARRLHEAALPLLGRVLADVAAGCAVETTLPVLPYRGFPSPDEMRRLARSGHRAAGWADLVAAFRTPT